MTTFEVSSVKPAKRPLEPIALERALAHRLPVTGDDRAVKLEATGANQDALVRTNLGAVHPVVEAVHTAFAEHYPLALSPDDVWLCIAQGFAMHVEANAEALRSRLVRHQGKIELQIERHDFVKSAPDNDWPSCFGEWSDAIAAHIGKKRDLVVASFSTTGPVERAASELVLMNAVKSYFDFTMLTLCGIPSVTLLGTVEDWRAIRQRAEVLAEFDLQPWVKALVPILDQFVAAASGKPDREHWKSIYKHSDESGGPYVNGWINVLFPYLDDHFHKRVMPNPSALTWSKNLDQPFGGAGLHGLPRGLSHVPLLWKYLGTQIPMTLSGGFVGVSQDPSTLAIRPAIGWAVHESPAG